MRYLKHVDKMQVVGYLEELARLQISVGFYMQARNTIKLIMKIKEAWCL